VWQAVHINYQRLGVLMKVQTTTFYYLSPYKQSEFCDEAKKIDRLHNADH
jgi:hypothetical protein